MDIKTVQVLMVVKADDADEAIQLMIRSLHMDALTVSTTVSDSSAKEVAEYTELFGDED